MPRVETLLENLSSPSINIRTRAAKNLIFKVRTSLLNDCEGSESTISSTCIGHINKSLESYLSDRLQNPDLLVLLFDLAQEVFTNYKRYVPQSDLNSLLSHAKRVQAQDDLRDDVLNRINRVVDEICFLEESVVLDRKHDTNTTEHDSQVEGSVFDSTTSYTEHWTQQNYATCKTNAGSIMYSELTTCGWKFPLFLLSDSDEHFLFDVEVKVKMDHESCCSTVFEVLADFPVSVVLQRVGLLESILDIIGLATVSSDAGLHRPPALELSNFAAGACAEQLSPLKAMQWLICLLRGMENAVKQMVDGSLCCHPLPAPSSRSQQATPVAAQMAQAVYAMRHPMHLYPMDQELRTQSSNAPSPATPSVEGLAFACIAAALPLLRANNRTTATGVLALVREAVPFIACPVNARDMNENQEDWGASRLRLQHLLSRMQQILSGMNIKTVFDDDCTLRGLDSPLDDDERVNYHMLCAHSCTIVVLYEILLAVPPSFILVSSESAPISSDDDDNSSNNHLVLGPAVVSAMMKMVTCDSFSSLFSNCSRIGEMLKAVSPDFYNEFQLKRTCRAAISELCVGPAPSDDSFVTSTRILELIWFVISCLQENGQEMDSYEQDDTANTLSAVTVAYCAAHLADDNVSESVADEFVACILALFALPHRWSMMAATSLALFLDIIPDSGPTTEIMSKVQMKAYTSCHKVSTLESGVRDVLLCGLLRPDVLYTLLMSVTESVELGDSFALQLVGVMLEVAQQDLECLDCGEDDGFPEHNLSEWCLLLGVLKTIVWRLDSGNTSCDTVNSVTSFALKLEELCAVSSNHFVRQKYMHSLVLGLFHRMESIRREAFMKIRHELDLMSSTVGTEKRINFVDYIDTVPLKSWSECASDVSPDRQSSPLGKTVSAFTHQDVRKLVSIAFGDCDLQIRSSALQQLNTMVAKDTDLLSTIDDDWCLQTARAVAHRVSSFDWAGSSSNMDDSSFIVQCAILFESIARDVPAVRTALSYIPRDEEGAEYISAVFILCGAIDSSSERGDTLSLRIGKNMQPFDLFRIICFKILSVWAFGVSHPSMWTELHQNWKIKVAYTSHRDSRLVLVPRFMWSDFLGVGNISTRSVTTMSFRESIPQYAAVDIIIRMSCVALNHSGVPKNLEWLSITKDGMRGDMCAMAKSVCRQISASRKHSQFVESVDLCATVVELVPNMSAFFYEENVLLGLKKVITVLPLSRKDCEVFIETIRTLRVILSKGRFTLECTCDHTHRRITFLSDILKSVTGPLLPLLCPIDQRLSYTRTANSVTPRIGFSGNGESAVPHACKLICQYELLNLLADAVRDVKVSPVEGVELEMCVAQPACIALAALLVDENSPSYIRQVAADCLNQIIALSDMGESLNVALEDIFCPTSSSYVSTLEQLSGVALHSDKSSVDRILRCARLMRSPDSMRGSTALLGSLRILLSLCIKGILRINDGQTTSSECTECTCFKCWRCDWILRYLHDRRSAVKAVALSLVYYSVTHETACSGEGSYDTSNTSLIGIVRHLLLDSTECLTVRSLAARIYTHMVVVSANTSPVSNEAPHFGVLLGYVADAFTLSDFNLECGALEAGVECLAQLMCVDNLCHNESFLGLLTTLKVLPKVVCLLRPDLGSCLIEACASRSRLRQYLEADFMETPAVSGMIRRWADNILNHVLEAQMESLTQVKTVAVRILQRVHELGGVLFSTCIRHTSIVRNVISILTDPRTITYPSIPKMSCGWNDVVASNNTSHRVFFANSDLVSSCYDLFSVMLARDLEVRQRRMPDGSEARALTGVEIGDLIRDKAVVTGSIMFTANQHMNTVLSLFESWGPSVATEKISRYMDCAEQLVTSILRACCLMVTSPLWSQGLGLGGDIEGCHAGSPATDTTKICLRLEETFHANSRAVMKSRVRMVLSLLLQRSAGLRQQIQSEFENTQETMSPMIQRVLDTVSNSVECFNPDCNSPLKYIKSKEKKLRQNKSPITALAKKSRNSVKGEKEPFWSKAVRGYSISTPENEKAYNKGVSKNTCKREDVTTPLELWGSLLLLVGILKRCEQGHSYMSAIGVHNALVTMIGRVSETQKPASPFRNAGSFWVPNVTQLWAAAVCAISTMCSSHAGKGYLLVCPSSRASTHISTISRPSASPNTSSTEEEEGGTSLFYRLLSTATLRSNTLSYRLLSVYMLGALLQTNEGRSSTARLVLGNSILKAVRESLSSTNASPDRLPPPVLAGLLDALCACLLPVDRPAASTVASPISPPLCSSRRLPGAESDISRLDPVMSIPELVEWVASRYVSGSPGVVCSLLRLIGRLGAEGKNSSPSSRKLYANVACEGVISTVVKCAENNDTDVQALVLTALWTILHSSEHSRAILKRLTGDGAINKFDILDIQLPDVVNAQNALKHLIQ